MRASARQQRAAALLLVIGAHIALLALIQPAPDRQGERGVPAARLLLRLIELPVLRPTGPPALPAPARAPAGSTATPRAQALAIDRAPEAPASAIA